MTKLLNSLLRVVELLLIAAGVALNHFTNTKMGMERHMMYENYRIMMSWKKFIFPVILVLLIVMSVYLFLKKKNAVTVFLMTAFAFYLFFFATGRFKIDKYAQMILVFLVAVIEFIIQIKLKQRT